MVVFGCGVVCSDALRQKCPGICVPVYFNLVNLIILLIFKIIDLYTFKWMLYLVLFLLFTQRGNFLIANEHKYRYL